MWEEYGIGQQSTGTTFIDPNHLKRVCWKLKTKKIPKFFKKTKKQMRQDENQKKKDERKEKKRLKKEKKLKE